MNDTEKADELLRREIERIKAQITHLSPKSWMSGIIQQVSEKQLALLETIQKDREAFKWSHLTFKQAGICRENEPCHACIGERNQTETLIKTLS